MEFFQVIVIVCSIALTPQGEKNCFLIRDELGIRQGDYVGLYRTVEQCNDRRELILEILDDTLITPSEERTVSSRCPKVVVDYN